MAQRYNWTPAPRGVGLGEAVAALALLATVNVFTVELSANRLPGVVARFAGQPASLRASYATVLTLLLLAVGPGSPTRYESGWSWASMAALAAFVVTLLVALLRFLSRSDAARAAADYVTATLPRARAAGRRFGGLQARAATLGDALRSVPMVTISPDEVHGEWAALIVARRRGILAPRRRDLRALLAVPAFAGGSRLRLFTGLGILARDGTHLGALVPASDQHINPAVVRRARRRLRIVSSDDVENVERGCVALVQLALDLAAAGDVGTAERVTRSALRLLGAHIAAARSARLAAFRRASIRAGVMAEGLRGDAPAAQAERRTDDEDVAPMVPGLRSVLWIATQAQLRGERGHFEVSENLLRPLLDATTEADGALAALPLAVQLSERAEARAVALTELLRLVGVRALEVGAHDAFTLVLRELDRLAANEEWADRAVGMTSVLAATAARFAGSHAHHATSRIVRQVALVTRTPAAASLLRRRALWRVGAAALVVGTMSIAVTVARLLATTGDLDAAVADADDGGVLDHEEFSSSLYGGYLGDTAKDAAANYGTFLSQVADIVRP